MLDKTAQRYKIIKDEPCRSKILVNTDNDSLFVFRELNYPGWKCFVNGKPAKMAAYDSLFRQVSVNGTDLLITQIYRPFHLFLGIVVTLTTLLALSIFAIISLTNKNNLKGYQ